MNHLDHTSTLCPTFYNMKLSSIKSNDYMVIISTHNNSVQVFTLISILKDHSSTFEIVHLHCCCLFLVYVQP